MEILEIAGDFCGILRNQRDFRARLLPFLEAGGLVCVLPWNWDDEEPGAGRYVGLYAQDPALLARVRRVTGTHHMYAAITPDAHYPDAHYHYTGVPAEEWPVLRDALIDDYFALTPSEESA